MAHALKGDHMPAAHALLSAGARLPPDDATAPVLRMLAAACSPHALKYILSGPSHPSSSLADAALLVAAGIKGCPHTASIVSSLLAIGANASAVGDNGHSALMRAAASNDDSAFRVLMQAGADVHCTSPDGANAFVVALMEKNEAAQRLLLPHVDAAMANPRSDAGQPALVAVATEGDADTLLALISHGARVSDVGQDGITVAHALAAAAAAGALQQVLQFVNGGAGGTCSVDSGITSSGTRMCADEIVSMVTGREQQHGRCSNSIMPLSPPSRVAFRSDATARRCFFRRRRNGR